MTLIKRDSASTIAEVIARNTGYQTLEELNGKSFYRIDNLDKATQMIRDAIAKKMPITIVGDYDADGVTSTGILYYVLTSLGANVRTRIPRRLSEGFGLNTKIIDEIETGLVITVDNGIVAFEPIKKAKEKGLQVIITDHHLPADSGQLPEADLIIDPHLPGTADFEDYCGAGIAYKLAKELTNDQTVLAKVSCFAAIGTVADVMPLVEENRQIVKEGLKNMTTYGCRTSGLYSILNKVDMDKFITSTDIAFKIGPMINACGRLFDDGAEQALNAIVYDGPFDENIGIKMDNYNEIRKKKVVEGVAAAEKNIALNGLTGDIPLVIYEPSIEEGIVGIIAGKLSEERQVPAFVFTDSHTEGIFKGSGRTAGEVHLKNLLDDCKDTLYKYGGHAEAAGVSVEATKFEDMRKAMKEKCPTLVNVDDADNVYYDLQIAPSEIEKTLEELRKYEPFGQGNPKPSFYIRNFQLSPRNSSLFKTMGENDEHIKLFGIGCSAVAFNATADYHSLSDPKKLDIVGVISENNFIGKSEVQIEIEYMDKVTSQFSRTSLQKLLEKESQARYED